MAPPNLSQVQKNLLSQTVDDVCTLLLREGFNVKENFIIDKGEQVIITAAKDDGTSANNQAQNFRVCVGFQHRSDSKLYSVIHYRIGSVFDLTSRLYRSEFSDYLQPYTIQGIMYNMVHRPPSIAELQKAG